MLGAKVWSRRRATIVEEILYPVTVGLLSSFTVAQSVNGKRDTVNKVLSSLSDSYFFCVPCFANS